MTGRASYWIDCTVHGRVELDALRIGSHAYCPTCVAAHPTVWSDTAGWVFAKPRPTIYPVVTIRLGDNARRGAGHRCDGRCLSGKRSCDCRCRGRCHGAGTCSCGDAKTPEVR